jgi:putative endonuclease
MPFFVYILKSEVHNRFYFGYTANLEQRIERHNLGLVKSTKAYRPWTIHYFEEYSSKTAALKRENYFKSINGYNWLKDKNIT